MVYALGPLPLSTLSGPEELLDVRPEMPVLLLEASLTSGCGRQTRRHR
jgi:hypothetical protein